MSRLRIASIVFFIITLTGSQIIAQGVERSTPDDKFDDGAFEKARNEYWYNIKTSGEEKDLGKINIQAYNAMRSMQNRLAFKSLGSPAWQPIAGSQEGHNSGRVRDVAADPNNPNVVYITTASGGVWKTPDVTAKPIQWISLSDRLPTLMGGAIAIIPPSTLLLGTGEAEGDGYKNPPGQGIFKSTDGGNNWSQVSSIGSGYTQISVDSLNTQIIYAASTSGILKSIDGGSTWRKLSLNMGGAISLAYNSHQPLVLLASNTGNIFRSADSGATWTKSMTGITGSVSRISVANAPSDPNLYYASIGTFVSPLNRPLLGIWMSTDAGLSWKKMVSGATVNPLGTQQEWCNSIIVRPSDAKRIFVAGLDMYTSNDSGVHWQQTSAWNPPLHSFPANYVHADHHHLAFAGNTLFDCGDGGIASSNSQPTYNVWNTTINEGLATLQFVGVDADKTFTFVTGGCQDNSTNRALVTDKDFTQTNPGDGGRGWVSSNDPSIVYTTYVYATFYKSDDGGKTFHSNLIQTGSGLANDNVPFYPAYDVSPDGNIVAYGGGSRIWTSTNGGDDGFLLKSDKGIGNANVVHIFQGEDESAYFWAGSGNNVWRSTDQGATWLSKSVGELVEGITSNPNNHNEVFVVTQGTSSGGNAQPTQKHFFKSEDGGVTFTNPATNFPPIGCWSIAYSPKNGNLYVGTDKGVIYSPDGGVTWNPLMNGMPLAEVLSLKIKGNGFDTLLAGTYGRGMFWTDLSILAGVSSTENSQLPLSLEPSYPNPITASNASMNFTLQNSGIATITLFDVLGHELRTLDKNYFDAGKHQASFSTADLAKGTYFVMLTANGRAVSQKIIVE